MAAFATFAVLYMIGLVLGVALAELFSSGGVFSGRRPFASSLASDRELLKLGMELEEQIQAIRHKYAKEN